MYRSALASSNNERKYLKTSLGSRVKVLWLEERERQRSEFQEGRLLKRQ
jgi:hypothetical protein